MAPRWVVLDSGQASSAAALLDVGGASRVADASLGTPSKESRKQHQRVPSFTAVNLGVAFAQLPGSGRKAECALAELWRRFVAQLRLLSRRATAEQAGSTIASSHASRTAPSRSLTVQLGRFLRCATSPRPAGSALGELSGLLTARPLPPAFLCPPPVQAFLAGQVRRPARLRGAADASLCARRLLLRNLTQRCAPLCSLCAPSALSAFLSLTSPPKPRTPSEAQPGVRPRAAKHP